MQTTRRVYDCLGRLKDNFGAEAQKTTHTHDGNGNEGSVLDPLLHLATHGYDELGRLQKTTDPDGNAKPGAAKPGTATKARRA